MHYFRHLKSLFYWSRCHDLINYFFPFTAPNLRLLLVHDLVPQGQGHDLTLSKGVGTLTDYSHKPVVMYSSFLRSEANTLQSRRKLTEGAIQCPQYTRGVSQGHSPTRSTTPHAPMRDLPRKNIGFHHHTDVEFLSRVRIKDPAEHCHAILRDCYSNTSTCMNLSDASVILLSLRV